MSAETEISAVWVPIDAAERAALGLLPSWPFARLPPTVMIEARCWLCNRPALYFVPDPAGGAPMAWCEKHARDF